MVAVGDGVPGELVGQPMCALLAGGGYAEYAVAPAGQCLPVPEGMSMVEAAALPETLFTVWTNLFERGYATEGDTVLVHGGTSGIGTMAIALCKAFGITVLVTAGSDDKCLAAERIGADHAINYKERDFVAEVKALTAGKGVGGSARHGRRRLCAVQPAVPGRRRAARVDRGAGRDDRDHSDLRDHAPTADADRVDAAPRATPRSRRWWRTRSTVRCGRMSRRGGCDR